jgi:predicted amidohydrolase
MKEDIDTNARTLAVSPELAVTGPATEVDLSEPQTHEPTPEEYRRRLNELLSGKM